MSTNIYEVRQTFDDKTWTVAFFFSKEEAKLFISKERNFLVSTEEMDGNGMYSAYLKFSIEEKACYESHEQAFIQIRKEDREQIMQKLSPKKRRVLGLK